MRPLSEDITNNVKSLLSEGLSVRRVAERLRIGKTTVKKIRNKHFPQLVTSKNGCPKKLSDQDKRYCVRLITAGGAETATEVAKKLEEDVGVHVDRMTVSRALYQAGMSAAEKEEKPRLSPKNIKDRLKFAKRHKDWTVDD